MTIDCPDKSINYINLLPVKIHSFNILTRRHDIVVALNDLRASG